MLQRYLQELQIAHVRWVRSEEFLSLGVFSIGMLLFFSVAHGRILLYRSRQLPLQKPDQLMVFLCIDDFQDLVFIHPLRQFPGEAGYPPGVDLGGVGPESLVHGLVEALEVEGCEGVGVGGGTGELLEHFDLEYPLLLWGFSLVVM